MECMGFKPPEDLVPNISMVKPTVAKLLLDFLSLKRALLSSGLRCKEDDWPLNCCRQTAPPVSSSFLRHTASLLSLRSGLSNYANSYYCAMGGSFEVRFIYQIHQYTTGGRPRELPSTVRSLPHFIAGFTPW